MKFLLACLFLTSVSIAQELFGLEDSAFHTVTKSSIANLMDPDLDRAWELGILDEESTIESSLITFKDESGALWKLQVYQNTNIPNGPTFFVPHDNENDAFLSGMSAIQNFGGHLLSLECDEQRICDGGIDPNRHFLPNYPTFSETILAFYLNKDFPIITLHNNHDSHVSLGGSGAIYSKLPYPYKGGQGFYHSGDPDDLIIYTDLRPSRRSLIFEHYSTLFAEKSINSIFEYVTPSGGLSGHMSTYTLFNTDYEYFNIEAQHGHLREQIELTDLLFEILFLN